MSYYTGDYYRGDYYRGDPFFGQLFGLVRKGIGALTGLGGGGGTKIIMGNVPAALGGALKQLPGRVGGLVAKHPVLSGAAAAGTVGILGGGAAGRMMAPPAGMRGFHISKKTGKLVRNRRMRVTNPKALRRAIRRAAGFERMAKRVMRFTSPHHRRRFAGFKVRRRKKL